MRSRKRNISKDYIYRRPEFDFLTCIQELIYDSRKKVYLYLTISRKDLLSDVRQSIT